MVSDFNKQNHNQNMTPPFLPIPSGRREWDDSGGVFTGGAEMRGNNSFQSHARGYNQERGKNIFTSHNPRRKSKGYVKAGASTLFKSGGSGGRFERRIFGYEFDDDSSMGSVDEDEEETPSKRWRSGNGKREKQSGGKGKGKGEVVVLDSSESEGEVKDNRIIEVDPDIKNEVTRASSGILKSEMGRAGEDEDKAVVINEGKSAHQQRMNWILEMTGRKRKGESEEEDMADQLSKNMEKEVKRGRGRPRKNLEMEMGGVDTAEYKRGRGRPRKVEILE